MVTVGGSFEVKPCLRDVVIVIYMEDEMDWLAGCIGLLLECPALQKINVVLHGGRFGLKRVIEIISGAFKALTKKFGRRLIFNLADDNWMGLVEPNEELIGNLEQLETLAANVNLDLEFKDSDYENDTEYYTSDSEEDER